MAHSEHVHTSHPSYRTHHGAMYESQQMADMFTHNGLWMYCFGSKGQRTQCETLRWKVPGWFMAARGLQCVALTGLFVASCYVVLLNWMQINPAYNRMVEIIASVSGLVGFVAAVEYLIKSSGRAFDEMFWHGSTHINVDFTKAHVSWGFSMDVCGCVLTFVASIIIAVNNNNLHSQVMPNTEDGGLSTHVGQTQARSANTSINAVPHLGGPATSMQLCYMLRSLPPTTALSPPSYDAQYLPAASSPVVIVDPTQTPTAFTPTGTLTSSVHAPGMATQDQTGSGLSYGTKTTAPPLYL